MSKILVVICTIFVCSVCWATLDNSNTLEQNGIETYNVQIEQQGKANNPRLSIGRFNRVLMSPVAGESLGLFDPYNGNYLGSLCYIGTGTPINAVQGPDNNIYISYQVGDKVDIYDTTGAFVGNYASSANGLDNTRGIDFRDGHCFITNGSSGTKTIEMSGPNTVHRIFIQDGSDPFDIYFLDNGKSLLADIAGSSDNVRIYDTNGTYIRNIFSISFPEQIQKDLAYPYRFLVAGFSTNNIQNFDTTGMVYRTWTLSGARGVYRLGNGNILGTNGTAVYEIDSATGTATIKRSGQGRFIEYYAVSSVPGAFETDIKNNRLINSLTVHPNPFKARTVIRFAHPNNTNTIIQIYNVAGELIKDYHVPPAVNEIIWNGKDNNGNEVPNGIYICNLKTADNIERSKIMLIK